MKPLTLSVFNVCYEIAQTQEPKALHVVNFNADPEIPTLIQQFHESSLQTISISHHSMFTYSVVYNYNKIMVFSLNDVSEILSLIFDSISKTSPTLVNHMTKSKFRALSNNSVAERYDQEHQNLQSLPRYCVIVDGHYLHPEGREFCDEEVRITSGELNDDSILTDAIFNSTRSLYTNEIWNTRSYLIFIVRSDILPLNNSSQNMMGELIFCFKFFWRSFKSRKSIICHSGGCDRYDPFTETIVTLKDATYEGFFDFSLENMHKKSVGVFHTVNSEHVRAMGLGTWDIWLLILPFIFKHLEKSINCTIKMHNERIVSYLEKTNAPYISVNDDFGFKFDADLQIFDLGAPLTGTDYSKLHLSPTIGSTALCIATPHSEYVPQSLVIFKSYMPVVWVFILITIILFVWAQYVFQYAQCEVFHRIYSEAEVDLYRSTSPFLTVLAFFLCGSPPTLLLGRLYTGKILFVIFSFSVIIITTGFLSVMTKFLSNRVSYPKIDTLKALEQSDLFIQTNALSATLDIFSQQEQSESLKAKLIDTLHRDSNESFNRTRK
ncbi:unnamed protein product [Bemisia tabaci]|uniref:Ionotropic receptor n=1 Tax=Bemisia tabaci TaxID=7038 RepID=A0A9P0AMF9_BEMTA|nr:unnamed protein product [Bemisia tabaci]